MKFRSDLFLVLFITKEKEDSREAVLKASLDFFTQRSDDVHLVSPTFPLLEYDPKTPTMNLTELIIRGSGIAVATAILVTGLAMIVGDRRRR